MGVAELGRRRRFAPPSHARIDWSHPLAQGLRFCVFPGVALTNLCTGVSTPMTGAIGMAPTSRGRARSGTWDTSNYITIRDAPILGALSNWTVMASIQTTAASTANGRPFYCERGSSGNDILKLDSNPNSQAGKLGITFRDDAGTLFQQWSSLTIVNDGYIKTLTITRNGNRFRGWIENTPTIDQTSVTTSNFTDASVSTRIGSDKGDASAAAGVASIVSILGWGRTLTDAEILGVYADPSQMLVW